MGVNIGGSVHLRHDYKPMADINVTPLVDVMLVLLIIFMITSPMLVAGVNVDLPTTTASPVENQEEPLSVTVDSKGKIYIQNTPVSLHELVPKLRAITKEKTDRRIFVRGDKRIHYGKIMDVVGAIHTSGFEKVALITDISGRRE